MEKIKVIDILVNIANGEEVPKKIKYNDYIMTYDEDTQDYYNEPSCTYALLDDIHKKLNDEVEVIEDIPIISKLYVNNELQYDLTPKEDKKIEKLDMSDTHYMIDHTEIMEKINEIIDKINKYGW